MGDFHEKKSSPFLGRNAHASKSAQNASHKKKQESEPNEMTTFCFQQRITTSSVTTWVSTCRFNLTSRRPKRYELQPQAWYLPGLDVTADKLEPVSAQAWDLTSSRLEPDKLQASTRQAEGPNVTSYDFKLDNCGVNVSLQLDKSKASL